jgi:hypothetical protein
MPSTKSKTPAKLKRDRRDETLKEAWIGDAVLTLYARLRILREGESIDGAKATRMTSNQFLAAFGEPSEVEAEIGRVYSRNGLDQAFAWIEARLMPLHEKHEAGRSQSSSGKIKR